MYGLSVVYSCPDFKLSCYKLSVSYQILQKMLGAAIGAECSKHTLVQVSEEKLIHLLGQVNDRSATASKITVQRRRPVWEDED